MRTGHLASGGNYRSARSELQSERRIPRKRKRQKEVRERKSGSLARRCDLYPDILRNSGKRYFNDFQTRSMEDPRWPSLPLLSMRCISAGPTSVVTSTSSAKRISTVSVNQSTMTSNFSNIRFFYDWIPIWQKFKRNKLNLIIILRAYCRQKDCNALFLTKRYAQKKRG